MRSFLKKNTRVVSGFAICLGALACIPTISFAATKGVKIKQSDLYLRALDNGKAVQCSLIKGKATAGSVRKVKAHLILSLLKENTEAIYNA